MSNHIMTNNSIKYTVNQLFKRANPNANIEYEVFINSEKEQVIINIGNTNKKIIFNIADDSKWKLLIGSKFSNLHWINNAKNIRKIPVLFWKNEESPFIEIINNSKIIFNGDIISSSFFMLSRWEEKFTKEKDAHSRFRYIDSTAYKYNFITIPVVDEYALLLRKYMQALLPSVDLGSNKFCIKLSHDIDAIRRFEDTKTITRTLAGDIIKRKNISLFNKSLKELRKSLNYPEKDPYFLGIYELAKISKQYGVESSFYFKTSDKSNYDSGYRMEKYLVEAMNELQKQSFELGFHAGYNTFGNYDVFIKEKNKLDNILGYSEYGGRQHYLKFNINETWKYWERAGLLYDSTLGYAEHEGFRCGTCHPFKVFDIEEDRELSLIEVPLTTMDVTLKSYRNLTPEGGLNAALHIMQKCKQAEGVFTLLWHNTSIYGQWEDWITDMYIPFISQATKL